MTKFINSIILIGIGSIFIAFTPENNYLNSNLADLSLNSVSNQHLTIDIIREKILNGEINHEEPVKVIRYSFRVLDEKNPGFDSELLVNDLKKLNRVVACKFYKESGVVRVYSSSKLTFPQIRKVLKQQNLGISDYKEESITVKSIAEDETK